jgi:hypothetical protein
MTIGNINGPLFQQKINELKDLRTENARLGNRLNVLISGGGPAGLIRAIESLTQGHLTTLFEKRTENCSERDNTVALTPHSISDLQGYGIYQLLVENDLIYSPTPAGYVSVRLRDLEEVMKTVIHELSPDSAIIHYASTITAIAQNELDRIDVTVNSEGDERVFPSIDVLVNAEGARSSTNDLIGNSRQSALCKVPVIAAVFKDKRPQIVGCATFFEYIGQTIVYLAKSIYYYMIYFFKVVFQQECFCCANRSIAGALILKTPGQNYVGCGLTESASRELIDLRVDWREKQRALDNAVNQEVEEHLMQQMHEELIQAEKKLDAFARYWINLSFCAANMLGIFDCNNYFQTASWLPLEGYSIVDIGADRAELASTIFGRTICLIVGDALATVDPTTGLGCNTAITTCSEFQTALLQLTMGNELSEILNMYNRSLEGVISNIHQRSRALRTQYRPDALSA